MTFADFLKLHGHKLGATDLPPREVGESDVEWAKRLHEFMAERSRKSVDSATR